MAAGIFLNSCGFITQDEALRKCRYEGKSLFLCRHFTLGKGQVVMRKRTGRFLGLLLIFFCLWAIPAVAVRAASAKPGTPVLSGSANQNVVTLKWTQAKNATGYRIYLYYSADNAFKCVKKVSAKAARTLVLTGSTDRLYRYKIRAYRKQGKKEILSNPSKELQIKTAPGIVVTTLAEKRSRTMNVVAWNKIPSAEGYQVVRAEKRSGPYKRIAVITGNETFHFKDNHTEGRQWYYRVRAYRRNPGGIVYGSYSIARETTLRSLMVIGDSRTVMMENATGGDAVWICKISMGYKWLEETAVPEAEKLLTGSTDVVIWLGVNDVHNISKYVTYLNELIPRWKARGVRVYILGVGQVDKDPYVTNEEIMEFNARMRAEVQGAAYMDLYTYLAKSGYRTTDGIHYDDDTSRKIYAFMLDKIA